MSHIVSKHFTESQKESTASVLFNSYKTLSAPIFSSRIQKRKQKFKSSKKNRLKINQLKLKTTETIRFYDAKVVGYTIGGLQSKKCVLQKFKTSKADYLLSFP